jgi:hypothetical protein
MCRVGTRLHEVDIPELQVVRYVLCINPEGFCKSRSRLSDWARLSEAVCWSMEVTMTSSAASTCARAVYYRKNWCFEGICGSSDTSSYRCSLDWVWEGASNYRLIEGQHMVLLSSTCRTDTSRSRVQIISIGTYTRQKVVRCHSSHLVIYAVVLHNNIKRLGFSEYRTLITC